MTTPLCKVCGKPVPKRWTHHAFGRPEKEQHEFWRTYTEKPATQEEAQRLVGNRPIVSTSGWMGAIDSAKTWDGESYEWGGHFHSQGCAARFGQSMADLFPDHAMPEYRAAVAAQKERAKK